MNHKVFLYYLARDNYNVKLKGRYIEEKDRVMVEDLWADLSFEGKLQTSDASKNFLN